VGHDFANVAAVEDHVAPVDPDALAAVAVIVKIQLAHQDKRVIRHCGAKLAAILARMLNDKLVDVALAPAIWHIHCDHKSHFSIPVCWLEERCGTRNRFKYHREIFGFWRNFQR